GPRRVEDAPGSGGIVRESQKVTPDSGVVDHVGAPAISRISENGAVPRDFRSPYGAPAFVHAFEEFPGRAVLDATLGNSREFELIVAIVSAGTVLRIDVDEIVGSTAIVASEVQESGRPEARLQLESALPCTAVVARPQELGIADVADKHVEN